MTCGPGNRSCRGAPLAPWRGFGPDAQAADLHRFKEASDQLAGLFLLVIAGEFNSGKSSFTNALLAGPVVTERTASRMLRSHSSSPCPRSHLARCAVRALHGDTRSRWRQS
jgi:hypothetical protein